MISNTKELSASGLHKDALQILEAAYKAIDTKEVIRQNVKRDGDELVVGGNRFPISKIKRLYVVGIGKCAFVAAETVEEILGDLINDGVIIDVMGGVLKKLRIFVGTHPLPSDINVTAAGAVMSLVKDATQDDLILCIISGGGSALLCWPHLITCHELMRITHELMKIGATIREINTVRKHISEIQGGQLAKIAYPAKIVSLIFSDVPGDDLSMVASGPTVKDTTTERDAAEILSRYNILQLCELPKCELVETPKEDRYFTAVSNVLVSSSKHAIKAMSDEAAKLGYEVEVFGDSLQGEARDVGTRIVSKLSAGKAIIGAGETTVTLKNDGGVGGRNQETVLASLKILKANQVFISAASDGEDNGPAAGAIADGKSLENASDLGLDYNHALNNHDSYNFFDKLKILIRTGKTGANVADLFIALQKKV